MKGVVFKVDRCVKDAGAGLRTVFYLKGCALRCVWCSTPEGLKQPIEPNLCPSKYDTCTQFGYLWSSELVRDLAMRDEPFMRQSGGGVTLSGGDPLFQPEFALDCIRKLHEVGLKVGLDTSGYTGNFTNPDDLYKAHQCLVESDFLLYDLKLMDDSFHFKYTEAHNETILNNLLECSDKRKHIIIRTPIIPSHNDDITNLCAERDFITGLPNPPEYLDLLTYHDSGAQNYPKVGLTYTLAHLKPPTPEFMRQTANMFASAGITVRIDGVDYNG
jgi:pyruvate formate lyase activating enzyme